ncbi:hypothetical protein CS542_03220 [Pedobacter sp. IW39]|nr:hypothetical protein CS542_03220 [Pedobacter sp. IW39]
MPISNTSSSTEVCYGQRLISQVIHQPEETDLYLPLGKQRRQWNYMERDQWPDLQRFKFQTLSTLSFATVTSGSCPMPSNIIHIIAQPQSAHTMLPIKPSVPG